MCSGLSDWIHRRFLVHVAHVDVSPPSVASFLFLSAMSRSFLAAVVAAKLVSIVINESIDVGLSVLPSCIYNSRQQRDRGKAIACCQKILGIVVHHHCYHDKYNTDRRHRESAKGSQASKALCWNIHAESLFVKASPPGC